MPGEVHRRDDMPCSRVGRRRDEARRSGAATCVEGEEEAREFTKSPRSENASEGLPFNILSSGET